MALGHPGLLNGTKALTAVLGMAREGARGEAFAMALEMIDARLPGMLAEFWSTQEEDEEGADE